MAKRGAKPQPEQVTGPQEPEKQPEGGQPPASTGAAEPAAPEAQQQEATDPATSGPDDAPKPDAEAQPKTIVVKGPAKGRWRAGRHFTAEPVSIPETDLTAEQIEALKADPALTVEIVDAPY